MSRRPDPRRHPSTSMWESVKSGEWQYGKALALAWNGEWMQAHVQFQAAAEKFRIRGPEEMLTRVNVHRQILECRCDHDLERRRQRAGRVMMRLSQVKLVESYRPPFHLESGPRLAESLWKDLEREDFLVPGVGDIEIADEMEERLG
ncbi:MAG: hypothetical protein HZB25_01455 [Candidatus Eisenbacteria bacterium]|nr:hypothetical protein [Candidatus Eisenbacteria bacterium]